MIDLSRRALVLGAPFVLAGCSGVPSSMAGLDGFGVDPEYQRIYGEIDDGRFIVPAIDVRKIDPRFLRRQVQDPTGEAPGTIVVDPDAHHLFHVQGDGTAMRYGIGVGREGFAWNGDARVRRKSVWPTWTPPAEMMLRDPKAALYAGGMPGGLDNPLGARALYLYQGDRDTLYRIHGTAEPASIGKSVSSGCIRLFNQDIIDLYNRVPVGTNVVVLPSSGGYA